MLDFYIRLSFILLMGMAITTIVALFPLLIIQTLIYKKILDPSYFNKNHFNDYELNVFNSFPLSLMKTLAYVRAIVFPKTMKKRFNTNILTARDNPIVYLIALLTMVVIIACCIILINTAVSALFYYSNN